MIFSDDLLLQEPRKVFINLILIQSIREIQIAIFTEGSPLRAVRPLRGLIASLRDGSKKTLQKKHDRLQEFEANPKLASRKEIEQIYWDVMSYLHTTYLKEFGIRALNPKPKHIAGIQK